MDTQAGSEKQTLDSLSDAEHEVLKQQLSELVRHDEDMARAMACMLWAKRVFYSAYLHVCEITNQEGLSEHLSELVRRVVANKAASEPYQLQDLPLAYGRIIAPELQQQLEKKREREHSADSEDKAIKLACRAMPPVVLTINGKLIEVPRGDALLLASLNTPHISGQITALFNFCVENGIAAIRLCPRNEEPFRSVHCIGIPYEMWSKAIGSRNKLAEMLVAVTGSVGQACQVIMVDNAGHLAQSYAGRPDSYLISEGARNLRNAAAKLGAVVVAGAGVINAINTTEFMQELYSNCSDYNLLLDLDAQEKKDE